MGKRLIVQRRGRGTSVYKSPSHKHRGGVKYRTLDSVERDGSLSAKVVNILHDPGRTAPVAKLKFDNGEELIALVPEGTQVGEEIYCGKTKKIKPGNIMALAEIPEGTPVFNIEKRVGDGGKFVRSAGTYALLVAHDVGKSILQLPSGDMKDFNPLCRATIGVVGGGGRKEKPLMKAGKKFHSLRARRMNWPRVRAVAMNVINHPYGGGSKQSAGKPDSVSRNAPPGRKVGIIAPKRTGKR
jgi:large subunit ribosomal protein L2